MINDQMHFISSTWPLESSKGVLSFYTVLLHFGLIFFFITRYNNMSCVVVHLILRSIKDQIVLIMS